MRMFHDDFQEEYFEATEVASYCDRRHSVVTAMSGSWAGEHGNTKHYQDWTAINSAIRNLHR